MDSFLSKESKGKILVVDDMPDNLRLLSAMLTKQGYEVRKALNGQLALSVCQKILPDLIFLDINMPEINGYEVCRQLKAWEETCEIPVIFISALDDVFDKVKAFNAGGIDYITKPFQEAEVISRLENHLKVRSLQIKLKEQNLLLQQEIIERQKTQEALELSEVKNRALVDAIPDLMFRIGSSGVFLDYRLPKVDVEGAKIQTHQAFQHFYLKNKTSLPNHDVVENSLVGEHISKVLSDDLAIWIMYFVEQTLLTSKMQIGEYVQQVNGSWNAYEIRFVKSGEDEVLALVRDISDRKQAEAARLQSEALLRMQKQQLEQALNDLKNAQTQLIQNEKMVALGELVAGIAHEINNPINFIYGNLTYVNDYIQNLVTVIEAYQQEYPNPTPKINKIIEDIDLIFLINDVESLASGMYRGAKRIQEIIRSLRNFSRHDESEIKLVNIHEGIDSTLLMLQHRLRETETRPAIEVIKEYGNLPRMSCYASEINQVFLNLLNNAIDALEIPYGESLPLNSTPQIRISTELTTFNTIKIHIADNGPGIAEAVQARLFDPFFTTKPVGKGTGLGLSISYQIVVQKHGGKITCCSSPGYGADFAIEIPVDRIK